MTAHTRDIHATNNERQMFTEQTRACLSACHGPSQSFIHSYLHVVLSYTSGAARDVNVRRPRAALDNVA